MARSLPVTGNTERTKPENRVHYPALDGFRALAFLLVFFYHYCWLPWGWCGVSFFFVLSGFLITGILIDTRDSAHRVRNFYVRRTLRIFPLYWGLFLLVLLSTPLLHWRWSLAWLAWPLYLGNYLRYLSPSAMQHGSPLESAAAATLLSTRYKGALLFFGHFWSLCVEEQFYLIWPWLIFFVRRRRVLLLCAVIVISLPILRAILHSTLPPWMVEEDVLYRTTPFQLDALVLGAILAFLWRGAHRDLLFRVARILFPLALAVAVLFIGIGMYNAGIHPFYAYAYPAWEYTWGLTFFNLLGAALMLNTLRPSSLAARLFTLRPARWIGRISYGAYVFHVITWGLFISVGKHLVMHFGIPQQQAAVIGSRIAWVFALPCTLLVAWLSFRLWESLFLNLKERWTVRTPPAARDLQTTV